VTHYNATPGMVNDLPAPVPGAPPGTRLVVDDPGAVQSPGERARGRVTSAIAFPATPGMRDDDASAPVPGSAPLPGEAASPPPLSPEAAAYQVPLPEGFTADPAQLGELKSLAVKHALAPEVAGELVALHAKTLQAQVDAEARTVAGWAEQVQRLPEWSEPGRAEAVAAVRELVPPSTRAFLDGPLGNHPEMVRLALSVGRELRRLRGVPVGSGHYDRTPGMRP
jgi:hypothetical protein